MEYVYIYDFDNFAVSEEDCDHPASHEIMRWTMRRTTKPEIARKCSQCPFRYQNPNRIQEMMNIYCNGTTDAVGWQSK